MRRGLRCKVLSSFWIQVPEALVEEGLEVSAEYCVEVRHLGFLSAVVEMSRNI